MQDFLIMLGSMSWQVSLILIVVLVLRKVFEKIYVSKKYMMILWSIPFFCLICPWKISLAIGFWNVAPIEMSVERIEERITPLQSSDIETEERVQVQLPNAETKENTSNLTGFENSSDIIEEQVAQTNNQALSNQVKTNFFVKKLIWIGGIVWGIGVLALFVYNLISYLRLKRMLLCSIKKDENVYVGDGIITPMVVGVFRPRIYIPTGLPKEYEKYVLAHEKTHIKRFDTIYKLLVYAITCIHWFNPVIWYAYVLFAKDIEMTCDEETLRVLGMEEKEFYAKALLGVAQMNVLKNRIMFVAPVAFEEGNLRRRIKNIMQYRKTLSIVSICAVIICIAVAVIFLTKEKTIEKEPKVIEKAIYEKEEKTDVKSMKEYYIEFIEQVEAGIRDDFQSVSTDELGINSIFNDGVATEEYTLGYTFMDVDSDGVDELLFGSNENLRMTNHIYDIYTIQNGEVIRVTDGIEGNDFSLLEADQVEFIPFLNINEYNEDEYINLEYQDNDNLTFADLDGLEFWFYSGAGAWRTIVTINTDGTFFGYYSDSDAGSNDDILYPKGTRNECNFIGRFSSMTKVAAYEYAMKCENIEIEGMVGTEEIIDGVKVITSEPYGFDNANEFRLYLPGKDASELSSEFLSWSHGYAKRGKLECYGLYNVEGAQGFVVYNSND